MIITVNVADLINIISIQQSGVKQIEQPIHLCKYDGEIINRSYHNGASNHACPFDIILRAYLSDKSIFPTVGRLLTPASK